MATRNAFLTDWVKDAYSMEMSLVTVLEKQSREIDSNPQMRTGISQHLDRTRQHVELLRDRLQAMGESVSGIKPTDPLQFLHQRTDGGTDRATQAGLVDYVTESYEVASYQAMAALARRLGDQETARICDRILQDEMTMIRSLPEVLPEIQRAGGFGGAKGTGSQETTQNLQVVQKNFDALNSHDLGRWASFLSDDYCGEAPGTNGSLDRQTNRDYIQNFFTAFPDLHFELSRTIADGDRVSVNWEATGTNTGQLRSPDGKTIQPTHKKAKTFGNTTFEFKDGKIYRTWVYFDTATLMRQLGVMG